MNRRWFLRGLGAMLAAPAVIHYANAMPIKGRPVVILNNRTVDGLSLEDCDVILQDNNLVLNSMFRNCGLMVRGHQNTIIGCTIWNDGP